MPVCQNLSPWNPSRSSTASQRPLRERNKFYYRVLHWPIWIFVFFIAPGPLTFDLFERGFDGRMVAWLMVVLVGTGVAAVRGRLPGVEPKPYIVRFTENRPNPLYRRVCYTLAWSEALVFAVLNIAGLCLAIATGIWALEEIYVWAYFPLVGAIWLMGAAGRLPRVKASTRGEGHERRYFYGTVWAVATAQPVLWFLWAVLPAAGPPTRSSWGSSSASWGRWRGWRIVAASLERAPSCPASSRSRTSQRSPSAGAATHRGRRHGRNRRTSAHMTSRLFPTRPRVETGMPADLDGWRGWNEYAEFYDWENARTMGRRDISFWGAFVQESAGPVLELGCGTGRVTAPLSRRGVRLVGVDRSADMLERGRRRLRRLHAGGRASLVRADVAGLPFASKSFAAVIAPYGILQSLLSDRALAATLAAVARVLQPDGRFGLELVPDVAR